MSSSAVASSLEVDPAVGLSPDEVDRRRARSGRNEVEAAARPPLAAMVWDAVTEPFVVLLFVAGVLAIVLGEVRDGALVLVGLLPIVVADVVTTFRSERALESLREAAAPTARVRRDGLVDDIPAADLVPGDVVLLRAGEIVPADLRLTMADRLLVDRSALTGESVPELGSAEADPGGAALTDRHSIAYAGTAIVAGRGEGLVIAIGYATEFGRIAHGLADTERRRSPLQRELDRLVRILLVVAIGLIAITMGLGFAARELARRERAGRHLRGDRRDPRGAAGPARRDPRAGRLPAPPARGPRPSAVRRGDARGGRPHHHRQDRHADREPAGGPRRS